MFAIIETGGKQYKVSEGMTIYVEKLAANEGETFTFDNVKAILGGEKTVIGAPTVAGAKVTANVLEQGKAEKLHIIKYKSKKNEKKKIGHRQPFTKVQIVSIEA